MKPEEAIEDIRKCIQPSVGGKSLQMAIEALEKQVPKKPEISDGIVYERYEYCPSCGISVTDNYCGNCGQKINWEETP